MKSIICPVSNERVEENTTRLTGLAIAITLMISLLVDMLPLLAIVLLDYFVRAFTKGSYGPLGWCSSLLVRKSGLSLKHIDKAPKIFAARVGFLFVLAGLLASPSAPIIGQVIIIALWVFALLESIGNLCIGCLIYTHIILRIYSHH